MALRLARRSWLRRLTSCRVVVPAFALRYLIQDVGYSMSVLRLLARPFARGVRCSRSGPVRRDQFPCPVSSRPRELGFWPAGALAPRIRAAASGVDPASGPAGRDLRVPAVALSRRAHARCERGWRSMLLRSRTLEVVFNTDPVAGAVALVDDRDRRAAGLADEPDRSARPRLLGHRRGVAAGDSLLHRRGGHRGCVRAPRACCNQCSHLLASSDSPRFTGSSVRG